MRKIIILPSFASSHFLKCSIPNWISVLEPDIIIINSGLFPDGPENKGYIDDEFRKKWCYEEDGMQTPMGFDWSETSKIVYDYQYSQDGIKPLISSMGLNYKSSDANECFITAISTFQPNLIGRDGKYCFPEVGDIIFPLEPDVLFHENDKEKIQRLISELKPGEGIQCVWKDFLQTQFYVEAINESNPKWRRFCYSFDNMTNYRSAMDAFMTQNYSKLKKTTEFLAWHYPWFVEGKFKQLRFDLIYRSDENYWKQFDAGLEWIKLKSEIFVKRQQKGNLKYQEPEDIVIRPSRNDAGRFATFVNVSHPNSIKSHPNFIK